MTRRQAVEQAAQKVQAEVMRLLRVPCNRVVAIAGARTGAIELYCGENNGAVLSTLSKNNAAAVRHLLWDFNDAPQVFLSGRCVRIEAQWSEASGLADKNIPLSSLAAIHPTGLERAYRRPEGASFDAPLDRITQAARVPYFTIGKLDNGDTLTCCFWDEVPHYAIIATSGAGKSVLLASMVAQLAEQVDLLLCDMKCDEVLSPLMNSVPRLAPVATTPQEALSLLQFAVNQMNERRKPGATIDKRIVFIIDEISELVANAPQAVPLLESLVRTARSAGIHLVLATQRPNVDSFGSATVEKLCIGRIVGKVADPLESYFATGLKSSTFNAAALGMRGHFVVIANGTIRTVQVAYLDDKYKTPEGEAKFDVLPDECDNAISTQPFDAKSVDGSLLAAALAVVKQEREAGTNDLRIGRGKLVDYCGKNGIACPGDKTEQSNIMAYAKSVLDALGALSVCLDTQLVTIDNWPGVVGSVS